MNRIKNCVILPPFKNSQNLLIWKPAFSSQILSKRQLFYHYFTKDKEDYEKYRKANKVKFRWEKNPEGPEFPMRKLQIGHQDDPELWGTMDKYYKCSPRFGENPKDFPEFNYRDEYIYKPPFLDRFASKIVASLMWAWLLYHLYWNHSMLIGHEYIPYPYEYTDEELGIPPDDAPDPEYWGNHDKPYRTYR
uniref:Uncharacterized protein n=1 Tax=Meloidogyne enterolobii TaxID=390850 RepID=A0A6V7XGJ1_MELEN|nr:unnamed protein product [Meloidogyne enterolobii]